MTFKRLWSRYQDWRRRTSQTHTIDTDKRFVWEPDVDPAAADRARMKQADEGGAA